MINNDSVTEASKVYDKIYAHIASKEKYTISNTTKASRIEKILNEFDFEERTALRCCCRYSDINVAVKISGIDKKVLSKNYKLARRHMYAPNNIQIAVPKFYKLKLKNETKLTKYDFGGQQYILTALLKAGIDTKEKLYKHLSLGWYYLWTIPGCGDNARQYILMAIDKWNEEDNNE